MHDLSDPAEQQFEMTVVHKGPDTAVVIELSGELDLYSAGILADRVDDLLAWGVTGLHVDAARLSFVDSSGLKTLLECNRQAAASGVTFRIVAVSGPLRQLVDMTGMREELLGG